MIKCKTSLQKTRTAYLYAGNAAGKRGRLKQPRSGGEALASEGRNALALIELAYLRELAHHGEAGVPFSSVAEQAQVRGALAVGRRL